MSDQPASTSQGETASTASTSEDNLIPPGAEPVYLQEMDSDTEVKRLAEYLVDQFPDEVGRTNYQVPESPVDVAIRLLTGLHAHTPPSQVERCDEKFCNKPRGHKDGHGWIHFG